MSKSAYLKLLALVGLVLLFSAILVSQFSAKSTAQIAEKTALEIAERNQIFLNLSPDAGSDELRKLYRSKQLAIYRFTNDSLSSWNNSKLAFDGNISGLSDTLGVKKLKHGYFYYSWKAIDQHQKWLLLLQVLPQFELQNIYLSNQFPDWTGIPTEIKLTSDTLSGSPVMFGNKVLFRIIGNEEKYFNADLDVICSVLFLLGWALLLGCALSLIRTLQNKSVFLLVLFAFLFFRWIMIYFSWPSFLHRSLLYDLSIFGNAASWLNGYLGDVFINMLLMLFLVSAISSYSIYTQTTSKLKNSFTVIQILLLCFISHEYVQVLSSLVSNSTISFDFLNVLNLKMPAIIAISVLCGYGLASFICLRNIVSQIKFSFVKGLIFIFLLAGVVSFIESFFVDDLLEYIWPIPVFILIYIFISRISTSFVLALGIHVLVVSILSSRLLALHIERNDRKELELLSYKLSERQDPVLENEFNIIPSQIKSDVNLKNLFRILPASGEAVDQLLKQKYFSGYFDRYSVELQLFDNNCEPQLQVRDGLFNNLGYFEDEIVQRSDTTSIEDLYFVEGHHRNTRYIAKIQLADYKLFVLVDAKKYEEVGTFPDLMLDRSQQKQDKLKNFSHAVYRAGQLSSHYGDLNYPFFISDSSQLSSSHPGYINHYYHPEESTEIIISERTHNLKHFFTVNSYMLLFFSVFSFFPYLIFTFVFSGRVNVPSLTRRIQTIVILLLLLSMSAIGYTSARLVTAQFETDNRRTLEEKTQVILAELTSGFSRHQIFDESRRDLINLKLKEFSRLFSTPISLFDKNGKLSNTSEPKLYELGLAAPLANPYALTQLSENKTGVEAVNEKAGTLSYLSLYTPVFDDNRQLLGFVNLPYFARQSELLNELSGIISALVNVYVLLFVVSIGAGLLLAGYITQPLRLIQQQIANVSLGGRNEKISWQSNDEIGKLVAEYNDMLLKLEDSALLLAQSERESAWREMARQVAHEIKNPLTPMKLNLQYLQHVMKTDPADFEEKFNRSVLAIIEQIDSLANIATEFSNFARLPSASLQNLNLTEVIASSVMVFSDNNQLKIVNHTAGRNLMVKGDREQCLRVFNNLLKNAIQAMEGVESPEIIIDSESGNKNVFISVKDNGCGIGEELKSKMFTPNFTTKSTGSGLGLAMVKNILEGFGGKIWYQSEKGKGATFFLEFKTRVTEVSEN